MVAMKAKKLLANWHDYNTDKPYPEKAFGAAEQQVYWDWNMLHTVVDRHKPAIRRWWKKKPIHKQQEVLFGTWPKMPKNYRPDWDYQWKAVMAGKDYNVPPDACVFSFINVEDLSQSDCLPMLLNARGRKRPHAFALSDTQFFPLGRMKPAPIHTHLKHAVMQF